METSLEVFEQMVHVFQMMSFLPLAKDGLVRLTEFIKSHIPMTKSHSVVIKAKSLL